jgi:hypothetical protein
MTEAAFKVLYEQEQLPVFQNRMYNSAVDAMNCLKGDMRLVEDQQSGLVFNAAFRQELVDYDSEYQNEQGLSPLFRAHLEGVSRIVTRTLGRDSLVEVGCGKGFFLGMLADQGVDVVGFDPTYEGDNPRISRHYFEAGRGIRGKGLVLRHVLEHIRDPFEFLLRLKEANGGSGRIYIEVPCFDWICDRRAWFDIFYEHVNYFRLSDFHRMFGHVVESGRLFGDQYLYVVADLESLRAPSLDVGDRAQFPRDFTRGINGSAAAGSAPTAIWGGASKGVIFALFRQRAGVPVDIVIDINPAKQGKYLPGTGLLVQDPQAALAKLPGGSDIYVMNSNYLGEIREMSNNAYRYVEIDRG